MLGGLESQLGELESFLSDRDEASVGLADSLLALAIADRSEAASGRIRQP